MSPPPASAEERILALLRQIEKHPQDWATGDLATTDRHSLERHGKLFYSVGELDWSAPLTRLLAKGRIHREGDVYRLTEEVRPAAEALRKAHLAEGFGRLQVRSEASAAYRELCHRVFGPDLLPFSLTDRRQMERLVHLLGTSPPPRVLDLGCGVGTLTETLQEATGGRFTGVDLAPAAIERARSRQRPGSPDLTFHCVDLDAWQPPPGAFDAIVGLDVLYFLDDLPTTLRRLLRALPAEGQMLFACSELAAGPQDGSLPADSRLVCSLEGLPVSWEAWDVSSIEEDLWRRQLESASDLESAFEAEGNGDLAEMLLREAGRGTAWVEAGRVRRFLYRLVHSPRVSRLSRRF